MSTRKHRNKRNHGPSGFVRGGPVGIGFHVAAFLLAFGIFFSRRPDAVLNAQFYAEDGMVWYPDAYQFGLHSYVMPVAGYVHALIRSVALVSLLVPFSAAPLVMNLGAMIIEILPVNVFLSSRFSNISLRLRLLACAVYVCLPNTWEIHANITNVQWHLALLAGLLLLAQPAKNARWTVFDGIVLVVTGFSTPIAILLVPLGAAIWYKRRDRSSATSLLVLIPGVLVELLLAVFSHTRQTAELGASLLRLATILGVQIFFPSLLGIGTLRALGPAEFQTIRVLGISMLVIGLGPLLYALWCAPFELKMFMLFGFSVLALGLARPLAGPPDYPQWLYLCVPGRGNRYFFFPMLGYLTALFWIASGAPIKALRYVAIALLCLLPIGIYQDWAYPPFDDDHFQQYAQQFKQAATGTRLSIPINPNLVMEITKR